jgi:hypothetical protein
LQNSFVPEFAFAAIERTVARNQRFFRKPEGQKTGHEVATSFGELQNATSIKVGCRIDAEHARVVLLANCLMREVEFERYELR